MKDRYIHKHVDARVNPIVIPSIFMMSDSSPAQIIESDMSRIVKIVESAFMNDSLHISVKCSSKITVSLKSEWTKLEMDADNKTVVVYHQNGDKGFYSCKIPWTTTVSNLSNNVLTVNVLYCFTYLLFVIIVLRATIRLSITV